MVMEKNLSSNLHVLKPVSSIEGRAPPHDLKTELTKLLAEYSDVFAWSYKDMKGPA